MIPAPAGRSFVDRHVGRVAGPGIRLARARARLGFAISARMLTAGARRDKQTPGGPTVAGARYNQLRDQASQYYDQGRQRAQEWEESLENYIHEKPLQAVLIAAGVGVLLGLLWKRS